MRRQIPLFRIYWDGNDIEKAIDVMKSGRNWAKGENIIEFERKIAEITMYGRQFAGACIHPHDNTNGK